MFKLFVKKLINKIISGGNKRTYTIYKIGKEYRLVKVLSVYDKHSEAVKDMVNVSTNHKTEIELLNVFQNHKEL